MKMFSDSPDTDYNLINDMNQLKKELKNKNQLIKQLKSENDSLRKLNELYKKNSCNCNKK